METIEIIDIVIEDGSPKKNPVIEAVALTGLATAQQASAVSDLAFSNQVSSTGMAARSQVANQDAMNRLHHGILSKAVASVQAPGPVTARSAVDMLSSNALAQEIADLKAAVAAFASSS